jgi:hypothetical protein
MNKAILTGLSYRVCRIVAKTICHHNGFAEMAIYMVDRYTHVTYYHIMVLNPFVQHFLTFLRVPYNN